MRIAKTDTVAGLPAPLARSLVRMYRGGPSSQEAARLLLLEHGHEPDKVFNSLQAGGFLARVDTGDSGIWWETTINGNALVMAGFGKPISRKTADRRSWFMEQVPALGKVQRDDDAADFVS